MSAYGHMGSFDLSQTSLDWGTYTFASVQPNITLAIEKKQIAENGISFFSIMYNILFQVVSIGKENLFYFMS